jgi:hypothetical protein
MPRNEVMLIKEREASLQPPTGLITPESNWLDYGEK